VKFIVEKGKIIILNGVSSAGKTTLAKILQERLSQPFFHMDVDVFCLMAPDLSRYYNVGDYSLQHDFVLNMPDIAKLFSDREFNLVISVVFLKDYGFLEKCVMLLHSYPVLLVHVTCPVDELRRREKERGDRQIGSTESMLPTLIPKDTYDIVVDTYNYSLEECADKIIEKLNKQDKLIAFETLWTLMQS
jgi:chloramphenicol 3-O phosphotransferase